MVTITRFSLSAIASCSRSDKPVLPASCHSQYIHAATPQTLSDCTADMLVQVELNLLHGAVSLLVGRKPRAQLIGKFVVVTNVVANLCDVIEVVRQGGVTSLRLSSG